jgi:hypothetical protein
MNRIEELEKEIKALHDKRYELENQKKVIDEINRKKERV